MVRICVLQGPSGCGKTTLLRSWTALEGQSREIVWVPLSSSVSSRQAFWQQIARSVARLGSLPEDETEWLQKQYNVVRDPVAVARTVLDLVDPLVLVLDGYEHLGDAMKLIDKDLVRLMSVVPTLRLIITTRSHTALTEIDPPGGILRVITHGELALTTEEVRQLIETQTGMDDESLARSVTKATRGFALTVRAVTLMLSQLGEIPQIDSAEWSAVIATRLESLLPNPTAVQFVTDTSVPPYMDVDLGQLLSENEETAEILKMLERNGFGRWIPYARNRQVFQYVETIRDTFRVRARSNPDRFKHGCVTTASWLLANEEVIEQALQYAIDGEDYALADRVFVSLVIVNPDSYLSDRFLSTIRKVSTAELIKYPMLAFGLALAMASNPVFRTVMPQMARIAVESTACPEYIEPTVDAISMAGMRAIAYRMTGEFDLSYDEAAKATSLADTMDTDLAMRFGEHLGTVLRQASYSLFLRGDIDEAINAVNKSIALCPTPTVRNYSVVCLLGYSAFAGDIARTELVSSTLLDREAWPPELLKSALNGFGVIAEGFVRLDALDFAGAIEILRTAEPYKRTSELWTHLAGISVIARQGLGQGIAEARRVAKELSVHPPRLGVGDNIATEHLSAVLALTLLAGGDRSGAESMIQHLPADSPYSAFSRIALLLHSGHDREALRQARILVDLPGHTIRTLAETQTVGAVAALRQNEAEEAWSWLTASAIAWETYGPRMHVALLAPHDRRRLLEFADERDSATLRQYLDIPVVDARAKTPLTVSLTKRECVVLDALAKHDSNREIADALVVSPHTVKAQLQSVYRKLGVSSRQAALAVARELGLVGRESHWRP